MHPAGGNGLQNPDPLEYLVNTLDALAVCHIPPGIVNEC